MREGEPDRSDDEHAVRARVRELVEEGRMADALDVVLDRVTSLARRSEARPRELEPSQEDRWLPAPTLAAIEGPGPRRTVAHLPRVTLEGDRRCPRCGGEDGAPASRERLELSAGALRVEMQPVLACGRCGAGPQPGLRPGATLLAHVAVAAHGDGVSYSRQALALRRAGASLSATVMEGWTEAVADALAPLAQEIAERAAASAVVVAARAGSASVLVGDELWCAVSTASEHDALLAPREGWIVREDPEPGATRQAASWEPLRRALVAHTQDGDVAAGALLALVQRLHQIERVATDERVGAEDRRRRRQQRSAPVLAQLRRACLELRGELRPSSPLAATLGGALARWEALARFVEDGRIPIDHAIVERAVRSVARLRSPTGVSIDTRAGTIATVLGTCELVSVDPVDHLAAVLRALDAGIRASQLAELLPRP